MLKNLSTPLLDSNIGALKTSLGGHIETYCSVHFSLNRIKAFCKSFFCVFTKGNPTKSDTNNFCLFKLSFCNPRFSRNLLFSQICFIVL